MDMIPSSEWWLLSFSIDCHLKSQLEVDLQANKLTIDGHIVLDKNLFFHKKVNFHNTKFIDNTHGN